MKNKKKKKKERKTNKKLRRRTTYRKGFTGKVKPLTEKRGVEDGEKGCSSVSVPAPGPMPVHWPGHLPTPKAAPQLPLAMCGVTLCLKTNRGPWYCAALS